MEPRFIQHQIQKQILSPQIRQYLKLLQMPAIELSQAIDAEMSENPLLEEDTRPETEESPSDSALEKEDLKTEELRFGEGGDHWEELETGYDERDLSEDHSAERRKKQDYQETLITKPETLVDFLNWQIRFLNLTPEEEKMAEDIVGNIDEEGYFRAEIPDIASRFQVPEARIESLLLQIQELDPPGIGARNLREALLIQLKKAGRATALESRIIAEHLPLLEKRDWNQLSRILCVDPGEIRKAASVIARLEPRPGRTFYSEDSMAVTPDATVYFDDSGNLKVDIHDEYIPEIRINNYYRRLLRQKETDEKTKAFLREKMQNAVNFIRALQLRKSTLRQITEEIARVQAEFFEKGFSHLRPLRLKDVADVVGIHESTVSRAIQAKYISTPQGTIAYKSFFSGRMDTVGGEAESQKSIMEKIRHLIDKEDAQKPLSDQDLVEVLKNDGIKIARRTVAKYREMLRILPSHLRRQK